MPVQDNEREKELCRLFNLDWSSSHERGGTDAELIVEMGDSSVTIPVEVKSTTGDTVSTARDVGIDHIRKWRSQFWIIGYYTKSNKPDLVRTLCLTPDDIEPWVASIEQKIMPDFQLAECAARRLDMADLFAICGKKEHYTVADAKKLHKMQWSAKEYVAAPDIAVGGKKVISPQKMLSLLQLRSKYIAERGATLNNPHITKKFLESFEGTSRIITKNWAVQLQRTASEYLASKKTNPFAVIAA